MLLLPHHESTSLSLKILNKHQISTKNLKSEDKKRHQNNWKNNWYF